MRCCPTCGKIFRVHKSQFDRGQGIYCSRSCARSGSPTRKKTRQLVSCDMCGNHFEKHLSEIRKNVGDKHFCSPECWYAFNQGENHAEWTGGNTPERQAFYSSRQWKEVVPKVWRRDRANCQRCGVHKDDYGGSFHIHHIVSFAVEALRSELPNRRMLVVQAYCLPSIQRGFQPGRKPR